MRRRLADGRLGTFAAGLRCQYTDAMLQRVAPNGTVAVSRSHALPFASLNPVPESQVGHVTCAAFGHEPLSSVVTRPDSSFERGGPFEGFNDKESSPRAIKRASQARSTSRCGATIILPFAKVNQAKVGKSAFCLERKSLLGRGEPLGSSASKALESLLET